MSEPLSTGSLQAPPEPGQLVVVRGRRWIASEVRGAALDEGSLRPLAGKQHLVTLSSVEDDGLGEELRVLWEIEPGASRVPGRGYPDLTDVSGFDDPSRLDAFLLAVRWGAVSSADYKALQAPFRSGIEIEDYQLEPLVRAVQMPRVSLLVADDVGLGKTIETGLVIQEFLTRHRARSVLIVCPSSLQIQWRDQMRDKFGLEFRIVDSDLMKDLRRRRGIHVNPWRHFPRLITSMDFVKRERPFRLLREVLPAEGEPPYPRRFDVLVVDEAHNVAPSGRGTYALDSQRTQIVRYLSRHFEHKLFLSATPHNGYRESFTALLEMLDAQRFAVELPPEEKHVRAVMVRRLKTELPPRWDGRPRFAKRSPQAIKVPYTDEEREIHAALERYRALREAAASSGEESFAADFVLKLLKKRLFSSPVAFLNTLRKHEETLRGARKSRTSTRRTAVNVLRARARDVEEGDADDAEVERQDALLEALDIAAEQLTDLREGEAEAHALRRKMAAWAESHTARPDSKAKELLRFLDSEIKPGGQWSEKRLIIFTEYLDTLKWLHQLLAARGFAGEKRVLTLFGGMDPDDREKVKAAFQSGPRDSEARLLLATDAASEGIDLQNHCSRLVHYEIPWNPNRMEQRNGRVDRYGQDEDVVDVYHFVDESFEEEGTVGERKPGDLAGDLEFLYRAVLKLQSMERDLFGKVAPVVAEQVEEAMLGRRRTLDTGKAERESEPVRRLLRFERDLKKQIESLKARLEDARRDLHLTPANIKVVVETALDLAGQPPLRPAHLARAAGLVFELPALRGSWAPCTEGIAHPHTGTIRPITFDGEVAKRRDDVVLVHLNHRLVQMSLRLLRAEVWSDGSKGRLNRFSARLVPDSVVEFPATIVLGRLVLVGGDGRRLHEEVIAAGGLITPGGFKRLNVGQVEEALASAAPEPALAVREALVRLWPASRPLLIKALEARMGDRAESLRRTLAERAEKEMGDVESVLLELKASIERYLAESTAPYQTELFGDERDQRERNLVRLGVRLAEIPGEIEHEKRAISHRFAAPKPQLFPVAVVFLVPRRLEREAERDKVSS